MDNYILEMRNITKEFPGVKALDNVNLRVRKGEIHCIVGENGAGKSTLMKVLSGFYKYGSYRGDILFENKVCKFSSTKDSENLGIAIISQEIEIIPELTIFENIFFGHEIMQDNGRIIDWHQTIIESKRLLEMVNLDVNPTIAVKNLRVGKQQLVEIAKALSKNAKLLILDEPTASLNKDDSDHLLALLSEFKKVGVTSIMISHRLKEVINVADSITVIRDGSTICTMDARDHLILESEIIKNMVGREIDDIYPKRTHKVSEQVAFELKDWTVFDTTLDRLILDGINIKVHQGEVVGIAGLMGSGRTELALSVFGNTPHYKIINGEIIIEGKPMNLHNPKKAMDAGLAYVTEDKNKNGLILIQNIRFNTTIGNLDKILENKVINENEEIVSVNKYKNDFNIRTPSIQQKVMNLSGGNRQKVSLAKSMFADPKIIILDEPTRGIDVGAKHEIYTIINSLVEEGFSVIMISSELSEILGMSDRIYVMAEGSISGEINKNEANEENVMALATNSKRMNE